MFKKLWLLVSLIAVMSLSTGIAFGHWNNFAQTTASITTGQACVEIGGNPTQIDHGNDYVNPTFNFNPIIHPFLLSNHDYANTTISIKNGDLILVMSNVYPTYSNEYGFDLYNCGTVPMEIYGVTFIPVNNTAVNATHTIYKTSSIFPLDLNGDGTNDIEIMWYGAIGNTVCPGDGLENSFYITFLEPVPQNVTVQLDIHLLFQNCESQD